MASDKSQDGGKGAASEAESAADPFGVFKNPFAAANPFLDGTLAANPLAGAQMPGNPMAANPLSDESPLSLHVDPAAAALSPEDAQELMTNMTALFDRGRAVWEQALADGGRGGLDPAALGLDPFNAAGSFVEWWRTLAADPSSLAEKTLKYWTDQAEIWRRATVKAAGGEAEPVADMPARDKRFKDPDWSQNAVFDALKQSYYLTAAFLTDTAHTEGALESSDRKKVEFFTRQFVEAISPSNYFATNPEVLRTTIEEKGENLLRGLTHMLEDLKRGHGTLMIRQTDLERFKVGENMAVTPGKVIFRNDLIELIQYTPTTPKVEARPIVIAPPWINKFYILDLNEEKSMVKWLVSQGHTVFMISWVNPDESHAEKEFVDYIAEGLFEGYARALDETGADKVHLAAYCVGGTAVITALAYLAQQPDHPLADRIASATFFTGQSEFSDAGELQLFIDDEQLESLDGMMKGGVLGAEKMATTFNMLRGSDLIWGFVVNNYLLGKDPFPFDLLYWNSDSTRMPAKVHRYYLERFYRDNALASNELQLGEVLLDLSRINVPTYSIAAKEDHIAPAASVYRGVRLMGGDRRMVLGGSGHIAGIVNPPQLNKYQYWIRDDNAFPETLEQWRDGAIEHPGSWWLDWDAWLKKNSGGRKPVPARAPGERLKPLADAPGEFVRARYDEDPSAANGAAK